MTTPYSVCSRPSNSEDRPTATARPARLVPTTSPMRVCTYPMNAIVSPMAATTHEGGDGQVEDHGRRGEGDLDPGYGSPDPCWVPYTGVRRPGPGGPCWCRRACRLLRTATRARAW